MSTAGSVDDGDRLSVTLARSWGRVLVAPRRFFRTHVVPGDQAPGLLFAMGVVLIVQVTRFALEGSPTTATPRALGARAVWIIVAVLFVTPAALHLIAALQTVLLIPVARDRGGVSETVQILAYAGAPCAFAGVPIPELRALAGLYATALLAVGLSEVHRIRIGRTLVVGAAPALLAYGLGFGTLDAVTTLLACWYII
jgi:hypothetical protein